MGEEVSGQGPRGKRVSLLAVASLVSAAVCVLSLFCYTQRWKDVWWPLERASGVAALVLGAFAVIKAFDLDGWWRGLGFLMGAVGLLVGIFGTFLVPKPCHLRESACRATCKSHLRSIGDACHYYADDNDMEFPPGLKAIPPDYLDLSRPLTCHSALREGLPKPHYAYEPGLRADMPGHVALAYDNSLENHDREGKKTGRNVLFADAHVEWWPASREAEFQKKLREQREAVRKWRAAGAKVEDMEKFFGKEAGKQ